MFAGAGTVTELVGGVNADLAGLDATALAEEFQDCQHQIARLQGRQLRAITALDQAWAGTPQADFVDAEIALRLHVTDGWASALLRLSRALTRRLPGTFTALEVGDIDLFKARIMAEYTDELSDADAAAVEAMVLGKAAGLTSTQLKRQLTKAIHKVNPVAARQRREQAEKHRRVRADPQPDGMADLYATLTAEGAVMIMLVLDGLARAARAHPGETRTLDELRADTLVEIFKSILETGTFGPQSMQTRQGSKPHVQVTIDALTLLGLADNPGYLAGYGTIPAQVARLLAADGTWRRLITDPVDGKLLDYGTTRYRPGQVLAEHVITRDQTCRWPGCARPAEGCDLDHTIPYPHGPTADWNLEPLSGHHHRAKHAGFHVEQTAPGTFVWRSPTGHTATVTPTEVGVPNPGVAGGAWDLPAEQWITWINEDADQRFGDIDP